MEIEKNEDNFSKNCAELVIEKNKMEEILIGNITFNERTTFETSKKNNTESESQKLFKIIKDKRGPIYHIKKTGRRTKVLGRKRKNTLYIRNETKHSKDAPDNIVRKIKSWVISGLIRFINKKIKKTEIKGKFYTINGEIAINSTLYYNSKLLNKKLYEILSCDISKKLKVQDLKFNYKLIKKIKEENIYKDIIVILNLNFLNCINHFLGKETIAALIGFENEYTIKKDSIIEYKDKFENFVKNIEDYYKDRIDINKKKNQ